MNTKEIDGAIARLLATENLVVEHRNVPTASFDVEDRILTLPNWDTTQDVYDMLVSHEVGHALFTPTEWTGVVDFPKSYLNVVEDARIEKMMKRKFRGLARYFSAGYSELVEQDFFGTKDADLAKEYNLIDRINLHIKIGPFAMIPFTAEEQEWVERTENLETFDEAVELAKAIYNWTKEQKEVEEETQEVQVQQNDEGNPVDEMQGDEDEQQKSGEGEDDADLDTPSYSNEEDQPEEDVEFDSAGPAAPSADDVKTQDEFDKQLDSLTRSAGGGQRYIELGNFDWDDVVVDWSEVHGHIDAFQRPTIESNDKVFSYHDTLFNDFTSESRKSVNYLVKEFEMKKSADAYARTSVSKTGVIDTNKLHTYSYNDDIFKRVTSVADGKNHGLVFVLDWSGSMSTVLKDTLKQLFMLTEFCHKVQIPFEVYIFTSEYYCVRDLDDYHIADFRRMGLEDHKIHINKTFNMVNVLSSRATTRQYKHHCLNLWREVISQCYFTDASSTPGMGLSGTPLNEAIVSLNWILPKFKKENGLQNVNAVILTDGEGQSAMYGLKAGDEELGDVRMRTYRVDERCVLRDRQTGRTYTQFRDCFAKVTNTFIQQVRDRNPGVSVMGIRVIDTGFTSFVREYAGWRVDFDKLKNEYRKNKSVVIPNPISFNALYAISAKGLERDDTEVELGEHATKAQINKAFREMIKSSGTNRKVLSSFIDQIA